MTLPLPSRRLVLAALGTGLAARPALAKPAPDPARAIAATARAGQAFDLPAELTLTSPLHLPDGAHLRGRPGGSRLVLASPNAALVAGGLAGLTLENVLLVGPGDPAGALARLSGVRRLVIRDCGFMAAAGNGLSLHACGGSVTGSLFEGIGRTALQAVDSTGLAIEGNVIRRCGDNGIQVHRTAKGDDGTLIRGNRIEDIRADSGGSGQYGNAINTFRAGGVVIEGNVIRRCAYTAVRNNGGSNVLVANNTCAALGETALYAEFAFDGVSFTGNIVDGAMTGISIANFGNAGGRLAVVSGNLLRNLVRRPHPATGDVEGGIGITVEADASITGNTVDGAAWAGLVLGWGPYLRDVTASGNTLRGAPTGIMVSVAEGAAGAAITGNVIAGARAGVLGMAWDKPATGDLLREKPPAGIMLSGNLMR